MTLIMHITSGVEMNTTQPATKHTIDTGVTGVYTAQCLVYSV